MDNSSAEGGVQISGGDRRRGDVRRKQIVEAAFAMIADAGLERLRTRDVADRAGINPATLHHYFATKELLIAGVAAQLEMLYQTVRAPDGDLPPASARAALHRELADARFYRRERPDMLAVAAEYSVDAKRGRNAAAAVFAMHRHWRAGIEQIIRGRQTEGAVCTTLRPEAVSMIVVGALWGATTLLMPMTPRSAPCAPSSKPGCSALHQEAYHDA